MHVKKPEVKLGAQASGYGRLLKKRCLGRVSFWHVRHDQKIVQLILTKSETPEYEAIKKTSTGSCIWFKGETALSESGEFSIKCSEVKIEALCAHHLPSQYSGVSQGKRYENQLLGLLSEPQSFELFRRISKTNQEIRKFLWAEGFTEFNTGVLHKGRDAGSANPFITTCIANNSELTLCLTSELKLRRLQIAGFENVFEILQSFRNEGIDSMHSPEFSLLEICKMGVHCEDMMILLENLLQQIAFSVHGSTRIETAEGQIDMRTPFQRISFFEACQKYLGINEEECTLEIFSERYPEYFSSDMKKFTWVFKVINKLIAPFCSEPTYITQIPSGISPLVKTHSADSRVSDRAALLIQGIDVADVYTDANDPDIVEASMVEQYENDSVPINHEYIETLRYGMPISGSIGMGLNRLYMLMRGTLPRNIKETILFPLQ